MLWHDLFGSDCGGTVLRQRRDKETTKKDKRTGRQTEKGGWRERNCGAGTSPAGALARVSCCHTKGVPFALASKDGGIGTGFFFELQNKQLWLADCAGDGPTWTAQNISKSRGEG